MLLRAPKQSSSSFNTAYYSNLLSTCNIHRNRCRCTDSFTESFLDTGQFSALEFSDWWTLDENAWWCHVRGWELTVL